MSEAAEPAPNRRARAWLIGPPALYLLSYAVVGLIRARFEFFAPLAALLYGALLIHGLPAMVFTLAFADLYRIAAGDLLREDHFFYIAGLLTLAMLSSLGWAASRRPPFKKQLLRFFILDFAVIAITLALSVFFRSATSLLR